MIIKYNNGLILDVDNKNGKPYFNLLNKNINLHEPIEWIIFQQILLNYDVKIYLNLGASYGYWPILAKLINSNIKVHAVEPEKYECQKIIKNMKLNNVKDIIIHNYSINAPRIDVRINNYNNIGINNFIASIQEVPDFITTDIQGSEIEFLTKFKKINLVKNIIIGTHIRFNSHKKCLRILRKKGFKIIINMSPNTVWMQKDGIIWARNDNI